MKAFISYYHKHPLRVVLLSALFFRLAAAIFSQGYGMTDDHYKIIEEANKKLNDQPSKFWTPGFDENLVSKRAMLYPVANYALFVGLEKIGIEDPKTQMLINRLLHAALSLLSVYLTYLICLQLSNQKIALEASWIAALFWLMPMLGVRNLIEVVCIPFLMAGTYFVLREYRYSTGKFNYAFAGLLFGLAFVIRYQTGAFSLGIGVMLLAKRDWKSFALLSFCIAIPLFINHVIIESWIYNFHPFEKLWNYISFNLENAQKYITGPWYLFILLFLGLFIPPFSFLLFRASIKAAKKNLIIVLPFLIFFLFHSIFPGKQERFILPVVLFFPIIGLIGLAELTGSSQWFIKHRKFVKRSKIAFWIINLLLLLPMSLSSSKLARVNAAYALKDVPWKEKNCLLLIGNKVSDVTMIPWFYMNTPQEPLGFKYDKMEDLIKFRELCMQAQEDYIPDYLFLFDHEEKQERLEYVREFFPDLQHLYTAQNSFTDNIMQKLNKRNRNFEIEIYKLGPLRKD